MNTKTILLSLLCIVGITTASAQSDVYCWKDGKAVKMENLDSLTFKAPEHFDFAAQWVDLGLSVKWARTNVGATSMIECGTYFAWGEFDGWTSDTDYSKDFFGYSGSVDETDLLADGGLTLSLAHDAAHVNWNSSWRMPTREEFQELIDNCTWTWYDNYRNTGVAGYHVASKKPGFDNNFIFLPAGGECREESKPSAKEIGGYYWTSSYSDFGPYALLFTPKRLEVFDGLCGAWEGLLVRAVLSE